MQVIICDNAEVVAKESADWVAAMVTQKPDAVLGLATGSTPIQLYRNLVERHQQEQLSFANISTFNLDEYYNIAPENPQSYRAFMNHNLFDHVDINKANTALPTCTIDQNPRQQGVAYEQAIAEAGGIDLQILGIGANGHIGFNEPTSSLSSRTRIKTLTKQTLKDNSRLFREDEEQPTMAMTMGIATIMDARYVLLMATGEHKAQAVKDMITGPMSAYCPASILQMHENAVILLDKAAASLLDEQAYFTWADSQNRDINAKFGYFHNY